MAPKLRSALTFSNVVSVIALFAALAGGAYAAGLIGPRDIARNAIRTQHVRNNTIRGADVLERTLGLVPRSSVAGSATTATTAGSATSASIAEDAQELDGIDSTGFLLGSGRTRVFQGAEPEGSPDPDPIAISTGGTLSLTCPGFASAGAEVTYRNTSADPVDVWTDIRDTDMALSDTTPDFRLFYDLLPMNGSRSIPLSAVSAYVAFGEFHIRAGAQSAVIEARVKRDGGGAVCQYLIVVTERSAVPFTGGG